MMRWLFFTFGIMPSLPIWLLIFSIEERLGFPADCWINSYLFSIVVMVSLSVIMTTSAILFCFLFPAYGFPLLCLYLIYAVSLSYYVHIRSALGE